MGNNKSKSKLWYKVTTDHGWSKWETLDQIIAYRKRNIEEGFTLSKIQRIIRVQEDDLTPEEIAQIENAIQ